MTSNIAFKPRWRWWILFLACMVTFGGYYSFDFPSVLHNQLFRRIYPHGSNDKEAHRTFEFQFSLLYTLYSLPNMVLPWFGGFLSDKFGNNEVMIGFGFLVLLGNILQTYACFSEQLGLLLFGRFVFGLGAETLQVCVNTTIAKWFAGKELAFALGINLSACKFGGVLTAWVSPVVAGEYSVNMASVVVSLICLLCFLLNILLLIQEPWYQPDVINLSAPPSFANLTLSELELSEQSQLVSTTVGKRSYQSTTSFLHTTNSTSHNYAHLIHENSSLTVSTLEVGDGSQLTEFPHNSPDFPPSSSSSKSKSPFFGNNNSNSSEYSTIETSENTVTFQHGDDHHDHHHDHHGNVSSNKASSSTPAQKKGLSLSVWLVFILTFIMYGTFIPFANIANGVLLEVFFSTHNHNNDNNNNNNNNDYDDEVTLKNNEITAAWLQSIPYFLTVFLTPFLGVLVDIYGYRPHQIIAAVLFLFIAHLLIFTAAVGPVVPLLCVGVAFSVFGSVIWPCIPLIVEERRLGSAYGIMASFQNTAQTVVPLVLQSLYRVADSYHSCEVFFMCLVSVGLIVAMGLWMVDEWYQHGVLTKP